MHAALQCGQAFPKTSRMAAEARAAASPRGRRRVRRVAKAMPAVRVRHWAEYWLVRAVAGVLAAMPLGLALRCCEAVASVAWLLDVRHRRIGMRNLAIAFPDRSVTERRRILHESFRNVGRMLAELVHLPRLTDAQLRDMVRFEDEAGWEAAITAPRDTGGLILSGHFGNWELLVYAHGRRGHPVSMVHRTIGNALVDRWFNAIRARAGTRLLRKSHAATSVLRALRARELLVLPFDQNSTRRQGVFVPFFGLPASTNAGLARIALRGGVPVVPVFIVRQGRAARHVVRLLPIMYAEPTGDFERDVVETTARFSRVFEAMVREHPEQWLWVHRRWKTRPAGEPRFY
jgi:Kdo2-lipid IVA lauroyltransferase/acyltransferase